RILALSAASRDDLRGASGRPHRSTLARTCARRTTFGRARAARTCAGRTTFGRARAARACAGRTTFGRACAGRDTRGLCSVGGRTPGGPQGGRRAQPALADHL